MRLIPEQMKKPGERVGRVPVRAGTTARTRIGGGGSAPGWSRSERRRTERRLRRTRSVRRACRGVGSCVLGERNHSMSNTTWEDRESQRRPEATGRDRRNCQKGGGSPAESPAPYNPERGIVNVARLTPSAPYPIERSERSPPRRALATTIDCEKSQSGVKGAGREYQGSWYTGRHRVNSASP